MRPYLRQPRPFSSVISADQWVDAGENTPPLVQRQLEEDLDYVLAMPELVRFRRCEQQAVADVTIPELVEEDQENLSGEGRESSSSSGMHRSRGISERLVDFGRKARGSFANLMGRKDSLWREEVAGRDAAASSTRGLLDETILTQPEPETYNFAFEAEQMEEASDEAFVGWPLDTMHLYEGDAHNSSLHLTQFEAGELLAARLRASEARGEFRSDVRDAICVARQIHTTEQHQWDASYDLMKTSAERRRLFDEAFRLGSAPSLDVAEDVDLNDLPFGLTAVW